MKNILKMVLMIFVITFVLSNFILAQDNGNSDNDNSDNANSENNNDNNTNDENDENDDSDWLINENELFGGSDDNNNDDGNDDDENAGDNMIEEVNEDNMQNEITVDTVTPENQDNFIISGKVESYLKFIFNRDNDTGDILDHTDFSMPLSLGLNFDFLIEDLILGNLNFSIDYVPQYYSYNQQDWVVNDLSISDLRLSLDIKSKFVKAHSEFTFDYSMANQIIDFGVDELFLDINVKYVLYARIGKQDLKWGSGYRWSPTDFLNDEKKDPLDPEEEFNPTGLTGVKLSLPLDRFNLIAFIGNDNIENMLDTSLTLRVEFAYDFFEISGIVHYQKDIRSLFGFDASAGGEFLYGVWDFWDELSFSMGSNRTFVAYDGSLTDDKYYTYKSDLKTPFFNNVFGFSYNTVMLPEIITTSLTFRFEYFFNGEGYKDKDMYVYALLLEQDFDDRLYERFRMGRHYLSFGVSMSNIFSKPDVHSDFNFSTNYMLNASDGSSILSFNLSYGGIDDISISLYTDIYFAKEGTEFFFNSNTVQTLFLQNLDNNLDPVTQEVIGYEGIIQNIFTIGMKFVYKF